MCFKVDDEYLNGMLIMAIIQILGIRRDKYVQPSLFKPMFIAKEEFGMIRFKKDFM